MNATLLPSREKEIVEGLKNGDQQAMVAIMLLYRKKLRYLVSRFVGDDGHAQDIVMVAFVKVWEKREFESLSKLRGFLFVIVKNECTNYQLLVRRRAIQREDICYRASKAEEYVEASLIRSELRRLILNEAENLPPARKKIFEMIFLYDLSIAETAAQLKLSVDTVRVQKARALQCLRQQFVKKGITYLN